MRLIAVILFFTSCCHALVALARGPKAVALDPASAGIAFQLQGEYEGTVGGDPARKLGAQVIALSEGNFHAVFLPGGLPGDGWDGKSRVEVDGRLDGETVTFAGGANTYGGRIAGGTLTGKSDKGEAFELKRVERNSPTLGAAPPKGAIVFYDGIRGGRDVSQWKTAQVDDAGRLVRGATSKHYFGDFMLHVEFILPFQPDDEGQHRGNSGVYLQRAYEIQILDSFGRPGDAHDCGSVYTKTAPIVNMCYPPLQWQTYDIDFTAARFDNQGTKLKNARVSMKHNGVLVQDDTEVAGPTGNGKPEDAAHPVALGQIYLQDHKDPVFFRNVWLVPKN